MRTKRKKDVISRSPGNFVKSVEQPHKSPIFPINYEEQKIRFFRDGQAPQFVLRGNTEEVEKITNRSRGQIRFDLLREAEHILYKVRDMYGDGRSFLEKTYGKEIDKATATEAIKDYLNDNNLDGSMAVIWCKELVCSATMMWQGPPLKQNRPEARKYSLWLNDSPANSFLREQGIICLLHHEIGTHFFRMFNDGLQPWFSDRKKFGLQSLSSRELLVTEEGLASIHTIMDSKVQYLWTGALLYYTACKSAGMGFIDLFDHLERFVFDKEQRWKHCMRVKRGLMDVNVPGGYGKDQCYFEGAVKILRDIDNIDFTVLMAGKICRDEAHRCKRLARTDIIKLPHFMSDIDKYRKTLRHIAQQNGLVDKPLPKQPAPHRRPREQHGKKSSSVKNSTAATVSPVVKESQTDSDSMPFRLLLTKVGKESRKHQVSKTMSNNGLSKSASSAQPVHMKKPVPAKACRSGESKKKDGQDVTVQGPEMFIYPKSNTNFANRPASCKSRSTTSDITVESLRPRAFSVCSTNVLPEIQHYSERMLRRKQMRRASSSATQITRKSRDKVIERLPPDIYIQEYCDLGAKNVHRFGCLEWRDN